MLWHGIPTTESGPCCREHKMLTHKALQIESPFPICGIGGQPCPDDDIHLAIRGVGDLRELRTAADLSLPQIQTVDSGYRKKEKTLIQSAAAIPTTSPAKNSEIRPLGRLRFCGRVLLIIQTVDHVARSDGEGKYSTHRIIPCGRKPGNVPGLRFHHAH